MEVLAVDSNLNDLTLLINTLKQTIPNIRIFSCNDAAEAIKYIQKEKIDIVYLSVKLKDVTGIELANKLKTIKKNLNIIFVTKYINYSFDAFKVQASDYILKPISQEKILSSLQNLRHPITESLNQVKIQCFGNFEIFVNDEPIIFKRRRSKEILAYLVDRMGAVCSMGELMTILWETGYDTNSRKSNLRNLIAELKNTLRKYNIEDIIKKERDAISIDCSKIKCDYYDFLNNSTYAINKYRGEYMIQYSWAEMTTAKLIMSE